METNFEKKKSDEKVEAEKNAENIEDFTFPLILRYCEFFFSLSFM